MAISPNGEIIAYTANRQLYVRHMSEMSSHPIGNELAVYPFFSPDGQWLAFYSGQDNTLKKIAVTGGAAVTLCPVSGVPLGASWYGETIFFILGPDIFAVPSSGGKAEIWMKVGESADSPQLLPGGKSLLLSITRQPAGSGFRWDKADIVAVNRETNERKVLIQGGGAARYIPTGHIVYALGVNLMAVPFDVRTLKVTGGPIPVVEGIMRASAINASKHR